ncbi:DUF3108 domain-containing protein [Noviherbaspirillum saxi]|uniref:DUF3108 domain-containing protein n=1 Tax=Noviherbaspirillum saxi TaxID=2320863 RepID=A0A3A3FP00_9BURK|nr:DUF3108 domain-containing protein [Noviherbaspirillum saxi]RJF97613.1 DUF3108 domain-containing protein [Noviherbaspirillum saxi]
MMKHPLLTMMLAVALCGALPAGIAAPPVKQKVNLPPSAELSYTIKAKQKGIAVEGDALMRWSVTPSTFSASNEARAMLIGKILDARSEGGIDAFGLAPTAFVEKRLRRQPTTTSFDRAARTISFSDSDRRYPIQGGEQDRNSVIWQLVSVARATPARFKPGYAWKVFVAGQRDADEWSFQVVKQETIRTPLGNINSLHLQRVPTPDSKDQHLDVWLAPSMEWYPVRVRYSEDDGDFIEQNLQQVTKKGS